MLRNVEPCVGKPTEVTKGEGLDSVGKVKWGSDGALPIGGHNPLGALPIGGHFLLGGITHLDHA